MTLASGTRLGPYEIVAPIGAGGMGEVYEAKDTRLERTVAIKVLPEDLAANPERRARFEREAKAISQLSHPNICTLHDVGEHEGIDYLVMERVNGETLEQQLTKGALNIEQTIAYGAQIADGLAEAHRAGIVHRDLKPANIMLTRTGAKLLDFGLAKPFSEDGDTDSEAETRANSITKEGVVAGTPRYMAPEQLRGKPVDARTDIFALGVILYEMVTAKKAFDADSTAGVVAAILEHEPPSLRGSVPPVFGSIVETCLRKDPDARFQSARDVGLAFEWVHGEQRAVEREPRSWLWPSFAGALGLALAASVLLGPDAGPKLREFAVMPPPGHNFESRAFERKSFAISPDGTRLAFVAKDESDGETWLWIRDLRTSSMRRVDGSEAPLFPFWAPSGDYVGFFADRKVKRVRADDGQAETVKDLPGQPRGGSWNADGSLLTARGSVAIHHIDATNDGPRPATDFEEGESGQFFPHFLPDSDHFLFYVRSVKEGARGVYLGSLGETSHRFLFPSESSAIYAEPGYLIFQRDGGLRAQRFDARTQSLSDDVVSLPYKIEATRFNQLNASVSEDGKMVYSSGGLRQQLTWYSRDGRPIGPLGPPGQHYTFRISPDGSQVVVTLSGTDPANLWLVDVAGTVPVQLTSSLANDVSGIWSDDGEELFFTSARAGSGALYRIPVFGSSEPERVFPTRNTVMDVLESERLVLAGLSELRVYNLDDATEYQVLADNTSVTQWISLVSPNHKWIAYWARESGRDEIYVTSFPEPGRRRVVSREGGIRPRWSADGTELFFIGADGFLYATPVDTGESFSSGEPVALFDLNGAVSYDVAPDGRILVNVPLPEPPHLNVIVDWTDGLR